MKRAHLFFGIVIFIIFLVTGRFMRWDFPDKEMIPPEFRMLMRSRHIYIFFSALLHFLLGFYLQIHSQTRRKILQIAGSFFLFAASVLLVWAFVHETYSARDFSDVSRYGLYLTLSGVILHLLANVWIKRADLPK
jgi:magnesium-transporting ATPase (P-type)